ncbi:MAG: TatD family hydrolase [Myxococcota bacterium]
MIDAHCHLQSLRISDPAALISRARHAGVSGFVLAGVDPADWDRQIALAKEFPECGLCYGLHPQVVPEHEDSSADDILQELADAARGKNRPVPVAIGELGLDRLTDQTERALPRQERVFRAQLALARECELPIVLHVLRAQGRTLEILEADGVPEAGGIVHSYSGSADLVDRYVKLGLSISFSGSVVFERSKKVKAAAARVPEHSLLVETDSPDQTPPPHHPGPNEPAFLPLIVQAVADARGVSAKSVAETTTANTRRVFQLKP